MSDQGRGMGRIQVRGGVKRSPKLGFASRGRTPLCVYYTNPRNEMDKLSALLEVPFTDYILMNGSYWNSYEKKKKIPNTHFKEEIRKDIKNS